MKIMKILLISGLAVTMLCTTAFATEVETELNDPNMVETTEIKNQIEIQAKTENLGDENFTVISEEASV